MAYDIRNVKNITDLISYFSQNLGWDISIDDFDDIEDISYDFDAEDVGLKEESFAKISSLRQLQPLVDGQKWGIFCVEFDSNRFEVSALRKILSGLIPRRRNSADHAVWCQQDLLFICNWGKDNNRTIGVAHFEDKEKGLPQIKMISCAPALEDFTQIKVFEDRLSQLTWPKNTSNIEEWRQAWSSAFTTAYRQTIHDSSTLTIQLAAEAQNIRDRILDVLDVESKNGYVHLLYNKFRDTLIHDMTEQQFADMYAQTVVYGLFSARCMDLTQDDFSAEEAVDCIPNTNPFLKSLMKECLGSQNNSKISFDELEIENVVNLLMHTKTDEIIADFNRQTGGGREDPVIHFYENFLTAYDKLQKVQRGVYYTPQPVVSFIVRAIDSIIKDEFGLDQGLASIETKKIKVTRRSKRKVDGYHTLVEDTEEVPAIQILDPATGTGTFIRQVILQIYENFKKNNKDLSPKELKRAWNDYVPKHLLPRINAFELMMAPYAVAHMKLAMVLKDTGYDFDNDNRLKVYLTNSLEEPGNSSKQLTLWDDPLAAESIEANSVKKNKGINIVLGNPPYAISTSNKNEWIEDLIAVYKTEPGGKERLKEQKYSIDSDEIKFIRFGQHIIESASDGILAYINPHAFLDKPTFRGMRWQLLDFFDEIYVVNLHGNSNHQEKTPDGKKDENVFDIQQGVCINIFVKKKERSTGLAKVYYADLFGERDKKYNWLYSTVISKDLFTVVEPQEPYYYFVPSDTEGEAEYYKGFCLEKLLIKHLEGIQSGKDKFVIHKTKQELDAVISDLQKKDSETIRQQYQLGNDGRDWSIDRAKKDITNNYPNNGNYFRIGVRPFDLRWSYYTGNSSGFIKCCRNEVSKEIIGKDNLAIVLTRNAMPQKPYSNFHIVDTCVVGRFIGDFSTSSQVFPLYSYENILGAEKRKTNFNMSIIKEIENKSGMKYIGEGTEKRSDNEFTSRDVMCYIYAFLNSFEYRKRFKEFLCRGFPYVPYPNSSKMFNTLRALGDDLIKLHLSKGAVSDCMCGIDGEDYNVESVKRKDKCVYINKTTCFTNVSDKVWECWIGGHQIAQKWIKERKQTHLSEEEVTQYRRVINIIEKTIQMSNLIDERLYGKTIQE